MNILFIHNSTGSRLYRILPIAKYLGTVGWNIKVRGLQHGKTGGISSIELEWADLVVVEMTYSPSFIKACHDAGAKVIYEMDDLMEKVTPKHYAHKDMNAWRTFLTYWCLNRADGISCTGEALKNHYKWFNQNIEILPNYLDLEFWERPYLENTSDAIRLGWVGGTSHREDLEFISPVIEKVLRKYSNVKFVCVGFGGTNSPLGWVRYNYGEGFFNNLPSGQYEFSLGVPMEVFPDKLASLRLDIAVAPVVENVFSRCKSNCKSQEYGINRIPGVYQAFLYHDAVINGETGYLATTEDEWFEKICTLIEMKKEDRKRMGDNAYNYIREDFDFKKHADKWVDFYKSMVGKECSILTQPAMESLRK